MNLSSDTTMATSTAAPASATGSNSAGVHKRVRDSCDACAFQRVKCDGQSPCSGCKKRELPCTRSRQRKKRGPKGPRKATADKLKALLDANTSPSHEGTSPESSSGTTHGESRNEKPVSWSYKHSPEIYHSHLAICRRDLSTLWPIIDASKLADRLKSDRNDWQAQALAASLCAATIAQLRLDQREHGSDSQPHEFAKEAIRLRIQHDYQEHPSPDSLLTSFFLHIYSANYQRLRSANYMLRETITTLQMLRLHDIESYQGISDIERQHRLRIFWIMFVTEKTFCVENYQAPILGPIDEYPSSDLEDPDLASSMAGLCALARLFCLLETTFMQSKSPSQLIADFQNLKPKIEDLENERSFPGISEPQHVDLNVTRHWLRAIIWRYFTQRIPQSMLQETGLSTAFPLRVAKDTLQLLSNVSEVSICSHGYGMELKLSKMADSILDIMKVFHPARRPLDTGECRDVLHHIGGLLQTVGGGNSDFADGIKGRLQELGLYIPMPQELGSPSMSVASYDYQGRLIQDSDYDRSRVIESVDLLD